MSRLLSVIAGNVYPGFAQVEFLLRNLAAQTFRDFELVLADAFYEENAARVLELSQALGLESVVHAPSCQATHVGRWLHWEVYSNSMLLASSPWVFHFGVHRYMHRRGLEVVADRAARGVCTVFGQTWVGAEAGVLNHDQIEQTYSLSSDTGHMSYLSQSGFFSIDKETLIHKLNGHNEALVMHHWVDCDLSDRAKHLPLQVECANSGLLRIERNSHYTAMRLGKSLCSREDNPHCIAYLLHDPERRIAAHVERFAHNNFEWVRCRQCGAIGIENPDAYMAHLASSAYIKAPINVAGVGRNIAILAADLEGCGLAEKVGIIAASHDHPRYLQQ